MEYLIHLMDQSLKNDEDQARELDSADQPGDGNMTAPYLQALGLKEKDAVGRDVHYTTHELLQAVAENFGLSKVSTTQHFVPSASSTSSVQDNLQAASEKFLQLFRNGDLGRYTLDEIPSVSAIVQLKRDLKKRRIRRRESDKPTEEFMIK